MKTVLLVLLGAALGGVAVLLWMMWYFRNVMR